MFCTARATKFPGLPPVPVDPDTRLAALPWCLLFTRTTSSAICALSLFISDRSTSTVLVVILSSLAMQFFHLSSASLCTAISIRCSAEVITASLSSGCTICRSFFLKKLPLILHPLFEVVNFAVHRFGEVVDFAVYRIGDYLYQSCKFLHQGLSPSRKTQVSIRSILCQSRGGSLRRAQKLAYQQGPRGRPPPAYPFQQYQ